MSQLRFEQIPSKYRSAVLPVTALLEKLAFGRIVANIHPFLEREGSMQYSLEPIDGLYCGPDESNPRFALILLLETYFVTRIAVHTLTCH